MTATIDKLKPQECNVAKSGIIRQVVAFSGMAGSGKSAAASYLIESHGFQRGKFATALKEMTRAYLYVRQADATTIERIINGDLKEVAHPLFEGKSSRYFQQRLGTEFGRNLIHPDVWVNTELDRTAAMPRVVFDDARFPNEFAAIKAAGGILIEIQRPGLAALVEQLPLWKRLIQSIAVLFGIKLFVHESEAHRSIPDIIIVNDGTTSELFRKVQEALGLPGPDASAKTIAAQIKRAA